MLEINPTNLARTWSLNVKIIIQHFLSCLGECEMWACTQLQACATDTWRLRDRSPTRVFMAFVLPFPLGSWIKGLGNYELSPNTMCSEGPRREIHISGGGGVQRTSTHWMFKITLYQRGGLSTRQINAKRDKRKMQLTFGNFPWALGCMFTVPWSTPFPSALPVTQACALIYRNCTAVRNTPLSIWHCSD